MNNTHSVSEKSFARYGSINLDDEPNFDATARRKSYRQIALELLLMLALVIATCGATGAFALYKFLGF